MNDLTANYDISKKEIARGRNLRIATYSAPIVLTLVPLIVTALLFLIFATTTPAAASILFLGLIISAVGLAVGLALSGYFAYRRSAWTSEMREKIAAHGIRAQEIEWFARELKPAEKRTLRSLRSGDPMLNDAFRETVASRLTATRINKFAKRELTAMKRRENKVRVLKGENSKDFAAEIRKDVVKMAEIRDQSAQMLAEAETRIQMIEAAATRGSNMADSELALKKLSGRFESLPMALEEARMTQVIKEELQEEEKVKE